MIPLKISVIYAIFSAVWILLSDQILLFLIKDPHIMTRIQMYKGWFFILVTSLIIFYLLRREVGKYEEYEKLLKISEEKYRLLVENASDAILVFQNGIIKFVNNKALKYTGYSEDDLIGHPFIEFIYPDDAGWIRKKYEKRISGDDTDNMSSLRMISKSGEIKRVESNSVLIEWEGRPATLNFVRDVTLQIEMEDRLRQLQKTEALGTLAGGIAHDFNNILHPLVGYAEFLEQELPKGSKQHEYAGEILIHSTLGQGTEVRVYLPVIIQELI